MLDRASRKSGGDSSNAKASVSSKARLDPQTIMLADAIKHNFEILPLDFIDSDSTWKLDNGGLRPGFMQIEGIGDSVSTAIIEWREKRPKPLNSWSNLIEVKGIGPKKLQTIVNFAEGEDPFNITRLDRMIASVRADLPRLNLPQPTHTAIDVPYERGNDIEVVWIGVCVHKNLRDIFEVNRARTGEELDPKDVKDPHLNEWMLLAGWDGTDLLSLRINRWRYPKMKRKLWEIKNNADILLVRGVKLGWRTAREIQVSSITVLEP
jgi:DNA polymerase-3 subunit alpha